MLQCGYVDTKRGAVLTGVHPTRTERQHDSDKIMKKRAAELTEQTRKLKTTQGMIDLYEMSLQFKNERNKRRTVFACMSVQN